MLWFLILSRDRLSAAITNIADDHQALLLLCFTLIAVGTSVQAFRHRWSLIPVIGMLSSAYLMIEIPAKSWLVFFGWMAIGLAVYFLYSRKHSKLRE